MKFPEQYRLRTKDEYRSEPGHLFGAFIIPALEAKGRQLKTIACCGVILGTDGWDHVSVSLSDFQNNTPSWEEMCLVKDLFWDDSETVVQYHVASKDHVNIGEVLHLWK